MAYRLQPTRLVEVLLPVLAALYHETEVPAGGESRELEAMHHLFQIKLRAALPRQLLRRCEGA